MCSAYVYQSFFGCFFLGFCFWRSRYVWFLSKLRYFMWSLVFTIEVCGTYGLFLNFDILCKIFFLFQVWSFFYIFTTHTKFPNCAQHMCTNLFLDVSFFRFCFWRSRYVPYSFFPNFDHGKYNFFPNFDLLFFGFWKWRSRCVLFFWPHTNRFCVTLCSYLNFFLFFHYETCSLNV